MKFPVLGICRGAQRMLIHVTGKDSQADADAINMTLPISWRTSDLKKSKLFGHAPSGLVRAMEDKPIAFFHSYFVVPTESFFNNTKLMRVFRVLSTNVDRNGTKFVSMFECKFFVVFFYRLYNNVLYIEV
jgi:Peptidase C26.